MSKRFYITTPIYYVNAEPHLGHAYTTIVADAAARFHRLAGFEVRFQTGSDEHGDKIAQAAAKEGIAPKAYADRISGLFQAAWPPLHIEPDNFIRTTDPDHVATVRAILQKVYEAGDIYYDKYGGNYCTSCERFLTDKELVDGKCPDHQIEPTYIEEENYFFRMGKYAGALRQHILDHPDFIRPERYKNEVLAFLDQDLEDLCISRPKSRLEWGISLPFDERFVTYVWFDALINYLTGLGWPDGDLLPRFWPHAQHLIAKDILKPHGIYWPTMLMSLAAAEGKAQDHYLYQHLNVHGYWKIGAAKMSKSLGNVVKPLELAQVYGPEAFRYFVLREMAFGLDAAFSEEALVGRYNADLANDLGNLVSRVLNMLHQYRGGVLPPLHEEALTHEDRQAYARLEALDGRRPESNYLGLMESLAFHHALETVWDVAIRPANKYVVVAEPWTLIKDPAQQARLDNVLHILVQTLMSVAQLIWPVMPETADKLAQALGGQLAVPVDWEALFGLKLLAPGAVSVKPPALFPRIDSDKAQAKAAKAEAKSEAKAAAGPPKKKEKPVAKAPIEPAAEISYDEFARIDLRLGTVLSAARVEGADRLLHLMIDLGEESGPRSIVAGIAQHYAPEELPGRQVVVVANLKPTKLKGVESRGMVLAAVGGDMVRAVRPDRELPPGSRVK